MSPAATHTVEDSERLTLAAADDLFYSCGIAAVTMADIRDRSGVSLRRLYLMYPAKSDLVGAWLEHRHQGWMAWFERAVAQGVAAGATPVDAIFDALAVWIESSNFRGCGFINALAETAQLTPDHTALIRRHKQALIDHLRDFTAQAEQLAVLIDGAIVQAAVFKSLQPIEAARRTAVLLV